MTASEKTPAEPEVIDKVFMNKLLGHEISRENTTVLDEDYYGIDATYKRLKPIAGQNRKNKYVKKFPKRFRNLHITYHGQYVEYVSISTPLASEKGVRWGRGSINLTAHGAGFNTIVGGYSVEKGAKASYCASMMSYFYTGAPLYLPSVDFTVSEQNPIIAVEHTAATVDTHETPRVMRVVQYYTLKDGEVFPTSSNMEEVMELMIPEKVLKRYHDILKIELTAMAGKKLK